MIKVAGLFAGSGGLDFGFKNAGFSIEWANEIEPSFAASYELLTGSSCTVEDFWTIHEEIPPVDVIVGGPPCQSFSLVGKRMLDDPRGRLVGGFMELIKSHKPRAFLMENVAGLASSRYEGQRLPDYLSDQFKSIGYEVLVVRVDASDFFVPQRRKRLIIIGVQQPASELKLIDLETFRQHIKARSGVLLPSRKITAKEALGDLRSPTRKKGESVTYSCQPNNPYQELMRIDSQDLVTLQNMPTMSTLDREFVKYIPPGGNYENIPDEISTKRIMNFKKTGGRTTTYGRLSPSKPAYTINTYFNRPNVGANYHYSEERLITVREAMRLQSFPDRFTPFFRSQRELHIQIGNAVPPLLAEALALSIRNAIKYE